MRAIRLLALRRLRQQPLRALIAAITVGAGASLAVAILITSSSLDRSVRDEGAKLAGPTPLRIVGATTRGGIDERIIGVVKSTDGVEAAIPLVQAVTLADGVDGRSIPVVALGVDCSVEALVGRFGCTAEALAAAAAVNGPPFVAPKLLEELGSAAVLRTDVGRIPIASAPVFAALDQLNGGRTVAFPLPQAQAEFARPGLVDVIYVQPRAGVDVDELRVRLEQAIGPVNGVLGAADPPPLVGVVLTAFLPLFSILAILVLAIGSVLVHNTVTLSMEERRRQLAIVGALGGTARTIVGGVLVEAMVLGLVGGVLGAAGGAVVARPIAAGLSDFTSKATGIPITVYLEPGVLVIALITGVLVSVLSSIRPARRAMRMDIAAELSGRDQREERSTTKVVRRAILWSSVAVVGINLCVIAQRDGALEPWQALLAPLAFVIAIIGLTLLVAALAPLTISYLGPRVSGRSAGMRLAAANLSRDPGRTGVMAVAVGTAVGIAFLTSSYTHAIRDDVSASLTRNLRGVNVSTLEPNNNANVDAKMPPAVMASIRALPGVASVRRGAVVIVGHEATSLIGVVAFEDPWFDVEIIQGVANKAALDAGGAVIGPALARSEGVRPGGNIRLDTPTGQVDVPVAAIWQSGDFGGRNVFMSYELLERLYGPQPVSEINVEPLPGTSADQLANTIRSANLDPSLRVRTASELASEVSDSIEKQVAPFWALQRGLLVMAFVAVLSTLLLVGVQRQRELGLLAAVGMSPSELAKMVLIEAGGVAMVGVVLGALNSLVMLKTLLLVSVVLLGYRNNYAVDPMAFLVYGVLGIVVALAAAALPAWRTARVEVLRALQYE
jgi:putative ABC transport system permease protein